MVFIYNGNISSLLYNEDIREGKKENITPYTYERFTHQLFNR
jgi:hypothetical protein